MTTKRTVTEKVISANKERAKKSTGPASEVGRNNSKGNALKTGATAEVLLPKQDLNSAQQPTEGRWREDYQPKGVWEEKLVRDLEFLDRKDAILEKIEQQQISKLEDETGDVFGIFSADLKLPVDGMDLPVQQRWVCERLTVRATATDDGISGSAARQQLFRQGIPVPGFQSANASKNNGSSLEIQAELISEMNLVQRYRAAIPRQRFKLVDALHAAQAERRQREKEEREQLEKGGDALNAESKGNK
jgi:hypothetical protein